MAAYLPIFDRPAFYVSAIAVGAWLTVAAEYWLLYVH